MSDLLERIFRIWILLVPIGFLLVAISSVHFWFRMVDPVLFVLPNDPAAWLILLTGILLIVMGLSQGFKTRVKQLLRRTQEWIHRHKTRQH